MTARDILTLPVVLLVLVLVPACAKHQAERHSIAITSGAHAVSAGAGIRTIEIVPQGAPGRNAEVDLVLNGFTESDATIEWLVNGTPEESESQTRFTLSGVNKGDTIQARATIQGQELLSNKIQVVDSPPEITEINFLTNTSRPEDPLSASVSGRDADGDPITYQYTWTVNGQPAGHSEQLGRQVRRGDIVAVTVTPYDGESYGYPFTQSMQVQNAPPVIQEHMDFQFDGTRYSYQVKASDPDGDPLQYALESPPDGMTIDQSTGLITWNVPSTFKGKTSVPVLVNDGQGGTATYILNISIQ